MIGTVGPVYQPNSAMLGKLPRSLTVGEPAQVAPIDHIQDRSGLFRSSGAGLFKRERGRTLAGPTPSLCDSVADSNGPGSLATLNCDLRTLRR